MKYLIFIFGLVLLTGCGASRYQQYQFGTGGYYTSDIARNEFTIRYASGFFTKEDLSLNNKYAMRRAAEKTLENGYSHFTCEPWDRGFRICCYSCMNAPSDAYDAQKIVMFNAN
jgi:hypothetical protein